MKKEEFDSLMETWDNETCYLSNLNTIMKHPACRSVAAAGQTVVPFILQRLLTDKSIGLSFLLHEITGENPMPEPDRIGGFFGFDVFAMAEAWIQWGKNKKLI